MTDLTEPVPPAPVSPPPAPVPPGWEGILDDDERILWQGQPVRGVDWAALADPRSAFGLFFAGFALFWTLTARQMAGSGSAFPFFGLPFLIVGLHMAVGRVFWDAYLRARTHYTLTDRHAFIATSSLGKRRLDRFALDAQTPLVLEIGPPGSVYFGESAIRHSVSGMGRHGRTRSFTERRRHGFERIADARAVYQLLREATARLSPADKHA